jgi:hypothetical protein
MSANLKDLIESLLYSLLIYYWIKAAKWIFNKVLFSISIVWKFR